ncbi:MAG: hypothetical protein ABI627_20420 [Polyangiaceae bacterium]
MANATLVGMTKCATELVAIGVGLFWMMGCAGKSQTDGPGAAGAQNTAGSASSGASGASSAGTSGAGAANWGACQYDSDCTLVSNGCCDSCEPVQAAQLAAINVSHIADQQNSICPGGAACAPCPTATQYEATGKYFKPVCSSGQCAVLDARESPLTQCKVDSDCEIRDGVNCCQGCSGSFVPASKTADFCDGRRTTCPLCVSIGADQYQAICNAGTCSFKPPLR